MLFKRLFAQKDIDEQISARIGRFVQSIDPNKLSGVKRLENFENKIEILVPCYNHSRYLKEAYRSILWQTNKTSVSLTFINDNSSDDSLDAMKALKESNHTSHINIKVISNSKNLLQAGSINEAVERSSNELFIILNADDLLTPDCLELIIKTYQQNNDIFLLGGSSLWFDSADKLPKHKIKSVSELNLTKYGPADALKFDKPNSINMSHSSSSFFRDAWEVVGGYFPQKQMRVCTHDDRDFQMRVCSVLPVAVYQDYPMEFYRTDSSQNRGTI